MPWVTRYHRYDGQGNTRQLTDETGTVTDTFTYDAWGNEVARTGSTKTLFRWNGRVGYYWDQQTGTYQVRRRSYSPKVGRFVSMDPILFVHGPNAYRYVVNNPVGIADPSGKDFIALAQFFLDANPFSGKRYYHLSLEYWSCCGDTVTLFSQIPPSEITCTLMHTVELINHSARIWATTVPDEQWEEIAIARPYFGVAVISYDIRDHGTIESVLPIYQEDEGSARAVWDRIISNAKEYRWAEQEGFGGVFKNWPRSFYFNIGTNSRTFIREMVKVSGLPWKEMGPGKSNHPGNDVPVQNPLKIASHLLWDNVPPHEVSPAPQE